MKTVFLFMSFKIKGTNKEGNWRAVCENFNTENIGHSINDWIEDRIKASATEHKVDYNEIYVTNIKCFHS